MIKNFLLVAFRSFLRQKLYSLLNILGLTAGLICVLLIYLWITDEVSRDRFHEDHERIFHTVVNIKEDNAGVITWPYTPGPLAEAIKESIPEVELAVRTAGSWEQLFQYKDKKFLEHGYYADPEFFSLFNFPILKGNHVTDPNSKSSVAISKRLADRLFGAEDPIGKILKLNNTLDLAVSAVYQDPPSASSLNFDFILPFVIYKNQREDGYSWGNFDHPLYLRLSTSSEKETTAKINALFLSNVDNKNTKGISFYLQNFADRNLYDQFDNGIPVGGQIYYVFTFTIVAIFVLLIACINFMNMSTARSATRAKEVGVRKTVGAQRSYLVKQFLGESFVISCVAMILALAVTFMILPMFNVLVSKQITISFADPSLLFSIVAIVVITSLMAGTYPAFFLSSFNPAKVLKSSSTSYFGGSTIRQFLIVFQFSITVILIACSIVIYQQINYIHTKNLGYDRDHIVTFADRGDSKSFDTFRQELLGIDGITHVSKASESLINVWNQNSSVQWPGMPDSDIYFRTVVTDFDYLQTLGLDLVEGRYFSQEHADTSNFVITQQALDIMGFTKPIGQEISQWGKKGKIVGVVNDFHSQSLQKNVDPIIFMCDPPRAGKIFVKMAEDANLPKTLGAIEKSYSERAVYPFVYTFLDDDFDRLYKTETITGTLALAFTIVTIIIAGLGLVGLAAFTAERRKKEISIRKTLGAPVFGIIQMITKDFLRLSLIASVIGCPLGYLIARQFLNSYVYHVDLGWPVFLFTALIALAITIITVIYQVGRAAIANPVDALRNE